MSVRTGSAVWSGNLKAGKGQVSTESGALKALPYGFNTRFEDHPGTNPEELIGAAHAACFSMALSNILGESGIVLDRIESASHVTLGRVDGAAQITAVHLDVALSAKGDVAVLRAAADKAKVGCPVSKLLKAEISMTLTLLS